MSLETKRLAFGAFVLDLDDQVLFRDGKPVSMTPKAYLLLKTLVDSRGRVVEKSSLMEAVWPDSFVEEGNLPFTINLLRKAMGDSSGEPQFIETVPKRGYRFIAEVTEVAADEPEDTETSAAPEPAAAVQPGRFPRFLIPILGVVFVLAASVIWLANRNAQPFAAPIFAQPFTVEQLATSGYSENAAISADGKLAVYLDAAGGKESVWLKNLESSESIQIVPPGEENYLGLTFANTSNALYFVRKPDNVHALPAVYRVEAVGGIPTKIIENVVERIAISSDDKQIAFVRCRYRKSDFCASYVANADGTGERKLFTTENSVHVYDLAFSPDGRTLAAVLGRYVNTYNDAFIVEVDIESGTQREIFPERFNKIESIAWLPDANSLLFSASDFPQGKASIWGVSRNSGKLTKITNDASSYTALSLDRTGSRLIAVQEVPDYRINVASNGNSRSLAGARDLTISGGKIFYSTFDGELWSIDQDGTGQRQLTNTRSAETSPRVSPDQRTIYFSSDESGTRHVWRMNVDGTERKQLTTKVSGYPLSVTADGKYIFYAAIDDGAIFKISADGTEDTVINEKRYSPPALSPDGTRVAHFVAENMTRKLAVTDLATGERRHLAEATPGAFYGRPLSWSSDGRSVYAVLVTGGKNVLWQHPIDSGTPQKIADLEGAQIEEFTVIGGTIIYISGRFKYDAMLIRGLG